MTNRDLTLDLSKGILITLVVLGHSIQYSLGAEWLSSKQFFDDIVFKTIYSFHMPLFMLISGYLFYNSNKKNFMPLIVSKLKTIGIPMLSFILLFNALSYVKLLMGGNVLSAFKNYIQSIFMGMTMWFLLSLLLNMLILAILTRLFTSKKLQYVGMIVLLLVSLFISDSIVLSVHKFMFPFFCIGFILKQNDISFYISSNSPIKLVVLTIISILAICWFDKDTYIYTSGFCILGNFINQLLINCKRMVIALVVSYTFMQYVHMLLPYKFLILNKIVRLGQISLFIYGFNILFNMCYNKVLIFLSVNFKFNYIIPIVVTICFLIVSYYMYNILEHSKVTRFAFLGK